MPEVALTIGLILVFLIFFRFKKPEKKEQKIEEIELSKLSLIWTKYNGIKEEVVTKEPVPEYANVSDFKETVVVEENFSHEREQLFQAVFNILGLRINGETDSFKPSIFAFGGMGYIHTSGLHSILRELIGEEDKEVLKVKSKEVEAAFVSKFLSAGFRKFEIETSDNKKSKSLYMDFDIDILSKEFEVKNAEHIIRMEVKL